MKKEKALTLIRSLLQQRAYIFPVTTTYEELITLRFYALYYRDDTLQIDPITEPAGVLLRQPLGYEGSHRCILPHPGENFDSLVRYLEILLHAEYAIIRAYEPNNIEEAFDIRKESDQIKKSLKSWTSPHGTKILTQRLHNRQFKLYAATYMPKETYDKLVLIDITILAAQILTKPYDHVLREITLVDMRYDYTQQLVEQLGSYVWSDPEALEQYTI